ncbi:hypothetical protein ACTHGU_06835 [Chitinophagaceae bacterium MMS25-I14]
MGYWITVHLFDDTIFYSEVVPTLRGLKGSFASDYSDFLKTYLHGAAAPIANKQFDAYLEKSVRRITEIANEFDESFRVHREYNAIEDNRDQRRDFLNQYDSYYEFGKFFEYYIFKTCADYYPYLPVGKRPISHKLNFNDDALAISFICDFDYWDGIFSADATGILNWAGKEDTALLYLDKHNIKPGRWEYDKYFAETFQQFLDIAHKNNLGLIMGVDMREDVLRRLPGNKLLKDISKPNTEGIVFKD